MKCSVCSHEITEKYCPECGQYNKGKRSTGLSVLEDFLGNIFSLEKSFFKNIFVILTQPGMLVSNYWNGFRGFYYSPGRYLTIASVFVLIHFLFARNFLGIHVTGTVSSHFAFLCFNIFLFAVSGFITYLRYKKNFSEHLILTIYMVSFWSMLFVPISILLNKLGGNETIEGIFLVIFYGLILVWISSPFTMSVWKRMLYIVLNAIVLLLLLFLLTYLTGN